MSRGNVLLRHLEYARQLTQRQQQRERERADARDPKRDVRGGGYADEQLCVVTQRRKR